MSYNKLILPITLGLSLVTVTAAVVYYIFKKDDDESNTKSVKTSRVNVIEISVPKSIVAALIGRGGSNVKEIEKKTGALIHFKKFSDKDYDVCIIRGRSQATQLAETMVHEFLKNQPEIVEDKMLAPTWSCGRIIGTGGSNMLEIMHRSGAKITIEGEKGGDVNQMRVISVRGTKEQIQVAKGLIEKTVAQEKCRREIEQSKRSPRHATPPAVSPTPDEATGDANKNYKYKKSESNGTVIEVYVSAVSSPSRFWVQFVGPQVAQLDELVEHMSEYYGNKDNRELHALTEVSVGQVVAAVFRHDGRWYRARVHDIRPNEFDNTKQVADVFFVDYGDSEYVAVHELCELRADLLRLRFQAMECFLAGVRPAGKEDEVVAVTAAGQKWERWSSQAVERFEELTQVARWKPLVSRTCTYKRTATAEGQKEREIPGIKLFDVTDEGELDIGGVLVSEGWATVAPPSPRGSPGPPAPHTPATPFGDLGNSKVLGMLAGVAGESEGATSAGGARCSSVPKDHKDDRTNDIDLRTQVQVFKDNERMTTSISLSSGLEKSDRIQSVCNLELNPAASHNGNHSDALLTAERTSNADLPSLHNASPALRDELKANINRIDSHHNNLELLGKHD